MKQTSFFKKQKAEFGGTLLVGKRKSARPLNSKFPTHLVLKASNSNLLLRHQKIVRDTLFKYAEKFGIKIYEFGVHVDHVHIAIRTPSRILYVRWIRAITSVLVQKISGLCWKLRPYTRLGNWGRAFDFLRNYIRKNRREGDNILSAFEYVEKWIAHVHKHALAQVPPLNNLTT